MLISTKVGCKTVNIKARKSLMYYYNKKNNNKNPFKKITDLLLSPYLNFVFSIKWSIKD